MWELLVDLLVYYLCIFFRCILQPTCSHAFTSFGLRKCSTAAMAVRLVLYIVEVSQCNRLLVARKDKDSSVFFAGR